MTENIEALKREAVDEFTQQVVGPKIAEVPTMPRLEPLMSPAHCQ